MKNYYLLIAVFICFGYSGFASFNGSKVKLDSSHYVQWNPDTKMNINLEAKSFIYDDKANIIEYTDFRDDWTSGINTLNLKVINEFNQKNILKSSSEFSYSKEVDSILPQKKVIYSYNTSDLPYDVLYTIWDLKIEKWQESYKMQYLYDKNGYKRKESRFDWHLLSKNWEPKIINEMEHDENGRLILNIHQRYNTQGSIVPQNKMVYDYDKNGNIILEYTQNWDNTNKNWVPFKKQEYEFNKFNKFTLILITNWNIQDSIWTVSRVIKTSYDSNQFLMLEENLTSGIDLVQKIEGVYSESERKYTQIKSRVFDNNILSLVSKVEYSYNEKKKLIQTKDFSYDTVVKDWKLEKRYIYEYDEAGKMIVQYDSSIIEKKYMYFYDEIGNLIREDTYFMNDSKEWYISTRAEYDYEYQYKADELFYPDFVMQNASFLFYFNKQHNLIREYRLIQVSTNPENDRVVQRYTYYYSSTGISSVSQDLKTDDVLLYPNPAVDEINIQLQEAMDIRNIKLINYYGDELKCLSKPEISSNQLQIPSADLQNGVYYLLIESNENVIMKLVNIVR